MARLHNFSPGPSALPTAVLEQVQAELLDWSHQGASVMEVSHRGKAFSALAEQMEADLRDLLAIPDDYAVLFLQGGATGQFAFVPLNLAGRTGQVDYLDSGYWSRKAIAEAKRYADVHVVASGAASHYTTVPAEDTWQVRPTASYLHYTPNETIEGIEIHTPPTLPADAAHVPLVADMSSTLLSRPIDVSRFGLIYAGAQKNIGPAGMTVVIVRRDLLGHALPITPTIANYEVQLGQQSMLNTPTTFAWYVTSLVLQWLKAQGGLAAMGAMNERKAARLYAAIDALPLYCNHIAPAHRSWMNVTFTLARPELDGVFLADAQAAGLLSLKGHRAVGGIRASLYNAVSEASVAALVEFMTAFAQRHG